MYREALRRCQRLKTLMYRGRCRVGIKQTMSLEIWLNVLGYVSRGIKKTQKSFNRKDLCQKVSRGVEITIELV